MEAEKLEGLLIDEVVELDNGLQLKLEDGTILVGTMFIIAGGEKKAEPKKEEKKAEPKKEEKKSDPDPEIPTFEELQDMDLDDLKDLIDEHDLDIKTKGRDEDDIREDIMDELDIEEPKKEEKKSEKKSAPAPKKESDDLEWDDLKGMDKDELADLVKEEKLKIDPEDYDDDEINDLRKAIAKKLDIEIPKK